MGRGKSGLISTSKRHDGIDIHSYIFRKGPSNPELVLKLTPEALKILKNLPKEQLMQLLFKENESEATECLSAQPSTPHERSPAWGHQTNST